MDNNIGLFLAKRAFLSPDRPAYIDDAGTRLSFAELDQRACRLGNALLDAGVRPGDRVGLLLMNGAEFVEAFFALARIGAVVVPLNWRLVADELEFILKDAGVTTLVFDDAFAATVTDLHGRGPRTDIRQWLQVPGGGAAITPFARDYHAFRDGAPASAPPVGARDDDLLYIMYTSGTTGLPKGVMHTHTTALWGVVTIGSTIDLRDGDRYLNPLPLFHVGALTPITLCAYRGVTTVMMRSFDPQRAWELIAQERVTTALMVPAMLNFMLGVPGKEAHDHSTLRWCLCGAAPVPEALISTYATMGIEIHQIYGLTESCGPACVLDAANALTKIGSTGKAFFHTDVRIADEHGRDCPPGTPGEVLVRGRHIMAGYWNRPDATAETIRDGWLHTGDVAVMDAEGFVYIQDRIKDMIISGGENVYPAEVENALMTHPQVVEAAVIGQPSARWGESAFAIVVRRDPALSEADVLAWCRDRMAGFKQPRGVAFVDTIPRNPSGKILKRILRERFPGPAPV